MRKVLVAALWCLFLMGCDQPKGTHDGTAAARDDISTIQSSTQVYTCPPSANPYYKYCPWLCELAHPQKPDKKDH